MSSNKISTGSYDFNKWLAGGYEQDVITMIAGPPGSGKSNFCVLVACSQAKKGNKVIFVDTEGGFSVDRVKQIVGEEKDKVLENIFVLSPTSFDEQRKNFSILLEKLKKEQVALIIIDSMAMLYRLELGDAIQSKDSENIKDINREVARQMRILSEISRKQNIPIVITNQVYSDFVSGEDYKNGIRGEVNLVGGSLFSYWCKCILELKNEHGKRSASLIKHRSLPYKEMDFEINNKGIIKRGWI